jgi:hypothetical protein
MTLCCKGAPLSVPNDTVFATRVASGGMALSAFGRYVGASASCRSSATAYSHWLADICHKV